MPELEEVRKSDNVIERLIVGKNDRFKKTYYFEELHLRIYLDVTYPNFMEKARIRALRSEALGGTEQNVAITMIYEMFFTIQEAGKDTRVFLTDDEGNDVTELPDYFDMSKHPREDILLRMADDLNTWASRFPG